MTKLRDQMVEELEVRNYSPHTVRCYVRWVSDLARHCGKSPDRLGPKEIRRYQVHLVQEKSLAWSTFHQSVCALRFFYKNVVRKAWIVEQIPYPRPHRQRLPTVLSRAEVVTGHFKTGHGWSNQNRPFVRF